MSAVTNVAGFCKFMASAVCIKFSTDIYQYTCFTCVQELSTLATEQSVGHHPFALHKPIALNDSFFLWKAKSHIKPVGDEKRQNLVKLP
jgi:hypothetical protein